MQHNTLQHAGELSSPAVQHTATHCNALQHTATHPSGDRPPRRETVRGQFVILEQSSENPNLFLGGENGTTPFSF